MNSIQPCDPDVFREGKPLLAADTSDPNCRADGFEAWVKDLATRSGQRIDWHYSGGVAQVLYLGDRSAIDAAITDNPPCPARIMRFFRGNDPGLRRRDVTEAPRGAIAGWHEGGSGSTYAIDPEST